MWNHSVRWKKNQNITQWQVNVEVPSTELESNRVTDSGYYPTLSIELFLYAILFFIVYWYHLSYIREAPPP